MSDNEIIENLDLFLDYELISQGEDLDVIEKLQAIEEEVSPNSIDEEEAYEL
jgi:hypothetical protein